MPVKQRFKSLVDFFNKNATTFANDLNVSKTAITRIINGDTLPSSKILIPLGEKLKVNLNWLLLGEGEMFISQDTTPVKNKDLEQLSKIIDALEKSNEESKKRTETMDKYIVMLEEKINELEELVGKD